MLEPSASARPVKSLGQHFLVDQLIIEQIVAALGPQRDEFIVEIGPGRGALTRPLLGQLDHLTVIELDRNLAALLRKEFPDPPLKVVERDILKQDLAELAHGRSLRVVGNLPYNISTPLLVALCAPTLRGCLQDAVVMVQTEVAERAAAQPGGRQYGRLSVTLQLNFRVESLFHVPPTAFDPPPKVMSTVMRLQPRLQPLAGAGTDHAGLQQVVTRAFGQRRKQLGTIFKRQLAKGDWQQLGIAPEQRPETLSPNDFVRLAEHLYAAPNAGKNS